MSFWDLFYDWYVDERGNHIRGNLMHRKYVSMAHDWIWKQRVLLAKLVLGRGLCNAMANECPKCRTAVYAFKVTEKPQDETREL